MKIHPIHPPSASITAFHALQEKWGASPSLDTVMVLTYIKFNRGFNTYKGIKAYIGEAMKY
jgi:hypothetical protein